MEWTPSTAADLSRYGCPECSGTGLPGRGRLAVCQPDQAESVPHGETLLQRLCTCVYRAVFRACYRRFLHCGSLDPSLRRVTYQRMPGGVDRSLVWVRSNEDFRADFHACGMRTLPRYLYQVFSFYHLHVAKLEIVSRRLGLSDRRVWQYVVEIETIVGREIAHLQPYSLFPPPGYMMPAGRARQADEGLRRTG